MWLYKYFRIIDKIPCIPILYFLCDLLRKMLIFPFGIPSAISFSGMFKESAMNSYKILLAEDDPDLRLSLEVCLRSNGFSVTTVDDGIKALEILSRPGAYGQYQLLITDIVMHALNGIELLVKAEKIFPDLPGIIITAYNARENAGILKLKNCKKILYKPFSEETLIGEIEKILHPDKEGL